jgi:multidrug transporter EmrE-like cation transporter
MPYLYVAGCVLFTVCGQLLLKWRASLAGPLPADGKVAFLLRLACDPWVLCGLGAGFLAFLCWMAAVTKLELSHAYPFMSLAFVLVFVFSVALFGERVTAAKVAGLALIVLGIVVLSRG